MRHEKPCQAKPAFLSGREVGCGKFSQIFQSEMAERRLDAIRGRLLGIEIRIPEPYVLDHRQARLHPVHMADNMRLLPDGQFFVSAIEPDCAAKGPNEPGKRPKQSP